MPDTLRTRIAAVLKSYGLSDQYGDPLPEEELSDAADAAIAELRPQLAAWARMCVDSGDMTPTAQRMLHKILGKA